MVIGNGMIATRFNAYKIDDRFAIFASGVSNSKNRLAAAYKRELELLKQTIDDNREKVLVYFSTCSVYDPDEKDSPYVHHKQEAERIIQSSCPQFYIFRVSNLVGASGNPNTVLNFFVYHILHQINFDLWSNASRNLLDTDDMYKIVDYILQKHPNAGEVINIANPDSCKVTDIVTTIEELWRKPANYVSIAKGSAFEIDLSVISPIIQKLNIHFGKDYLVNLLKKYYGKHDL
jgi:nucleoside-diphosphate-sugar epimerase